MWQALVGTALKALQNKNGEGQQTTNSVANAYQQGQQNMADMRNGLEIGDDDRSAIANSINRGYGVY